MLHSEMDDKFMDTNNELGSDNSTAFLSADGNTPRMANTRFRLLRSSKIASPDSNKLG